MVSNKIILEDLETDLWEMCNLKCSQCTHISPLFTSTDKPYSLESFISDIDVLNKISHVHAFRIVGGEPLLNKNLLPYIRHLKESKFADYITIFTNGIVLSHTNNNIFPYIDRLRISVYTNLEPKKINLIYANIEKIKNMYPHLDVVSNEISYFSKFNLNEENTNVALVNKIYNSCYYSYEHRGLSIYEGRFFKCFASRKKFKYAPLSSDVDSIAINSHLTAADLKKFIEDKTPLESCKWCLGTCGKQIKHTQISKNQKDVATINDLDFEESSSYLSNLLLSWDKNNKKFNNLKNNKFFKLSKLKDYLKYFKI